MVRKTQHIYMVHTHLNPADYVVHVFKGVRAAARAIGRDPSNISKWRRTRDRSGTVGKVPAGVQRLILEKAKESGLDITAEDLIFGRTIEQAVEK